MAATAKMATAAAQMVRFGITWNAPFGFGQYLAWTYYLTSVWKLVRIGQKNKKQF